MEISTKINDNCLIVKMRGEFDLHSVPKFKKRIIKIMAAHNLIHLVLSFKGVIFVDSSGLGAILGRYRELDKKGGKVFLINLRPQVKKVFTLAGLLKIMQEYDSEETAIEQLNKGGI